MSYGAAGVGQGAAEGLAQFGRILAGISAKREQEDFLAQEEQRRQEALQREEERYRNQLLTTPGVSSERPGVNFQVPGMRAPMSGAQGPAMNVSKPFEGVSELNVGDEALYFDPNQQQRRQRADNRQAFESLPEDVRGDLGDYNPRADYGGIPTMIAQSKLDRRQAGGQGGVIRDDLGDRVLIRDRITGAVLDEQPKGATPGGGPGGGGNLNDAQSKSVLYTVNGEVGLRNLVDAFEDLGRPPNLVERQAGEHVWAQGTNNPEVQRFQQAARSILAAILRKESGAAITEFEMANDGRKWIPQPGDSEAVIEQKLNGIRIALDGIRATTGPGGSEVDRILQENGIQPWRPAGQTDGQMGGQNPFELNYQRRNSGSGSGGTIR